MRITTLRGNNIRIWSNIELIPDTNQSLHCIVGPNGAGKTSLLEMIWLLSRQRGLRGQSLTSLLQHGQSSATVVAHIKSDKTSVEEVLRLQWQRGAKRSYTIDGEAVSAAQFQSKLPVVAFQPTDLRIFTDGPDLRRSELQRLCFYIVPDFLASFQRYATALQQRNAALRLPTFDREAIAYWQRQLEQYGGIIERTMIEQWFCLFTLMLPTFRELFNTIKIDATYTGISGTIRLNDALSRGEFMAQIPSASDLQTRFHSMLQDSFEKDRRAGYTTRGPHRLDWQVEINGHKLKDVASIGQMRSAAISLRLALAEWINCETGESPIVLFDDVLGDLDQYRRGQVINHLQNHSHQVWLTATDASSNLDAQVWQVENGTVL